MTRRSSSCTASRLGYAEPTTTGRLCSVTTGRMVGVVVLLLFIGAAEFSSSAMALTTTPQQRLVAAMNNPRISSYSLTTDVILTAPLPPVTRRFSITGNCRKNGRIAPCVISGGRRYRGFAVLGGNLSLTRIALNNCKVTRTSTEFFFQDRSNIGAAVYVDNGTFVASSCSFTGNNAARSYGGAIVGYESKVTITRSSFTDNRADKDGGAMALILGRAKVDGSTFTRNNAGMSGGAIHTTYSPLQMTTSTLRFNRAGSRDGGALWIYDPSTEDQGTTTISSTTFDKNSAPNGLGGAVSIGITDDEGDDDSVYFCGRNTFTRNTASTPSSANGAVDVAEDAHGWEKVYFCNGVPPGFLSDPPTAVTTGCTRC